MQSGFVLFGPLRMTSCAGGAAFAASIVLLASLQGCVRQTVARTAFVPLATWRSPESVPYADCVTSNPSNLVRVSHGACPPCEERRREQRPSSGDELFALGPLVVELLVRVVKVFRLSR